MTKKIAGLFALMMVFSWSIFGQTGQISGKITDRLSGEPLPGATVVVEGTTQGTTADIDGEYSLTVSEGNITLVAKFLGYIDSSVSIEVEAGENMTQNFSLDPDITMLDEFIVVGYGIQRKSDLTGSIASVDGEELASQSEGNIANLIQGRASGVQVTSTSGAPGTGVNIRIRGTGTVGDPSPLYVVDGILTNDISTISPNDIANIEILKDASATAIYGSRGANGVVLVTTKTGTEGVSQITYESMGGVRNPWKTPDLLNSEEWYDVISIARENGDMEPFTLVDPADNLDHTTDWFDEVTRQGRVQSHNLSFSEGTERTSYLISGGYYEEVGIVKKSDYNRLNFRANIDSRMNSWLNVGTRLSMSHSTRNVVPADYYNGIINVAQKLDPITPVENESGFISSPYTDVKNPVAALDRDINENQRYTLLGNAFLDLTPIEGLTLRSSFSLEMRRDNGHIFNPAYNMAPDERQDLSVVEKSNSLYNGWLWDNTATYRFDIEDHGFTLLAGYTSELNYSEWLTGRKQNTPGDDPELQYLDAASEGDQANNSGVENAMYSYLGRINYTYSDRYLLTASIRRDGSSVFGPGNRFGTFPSVSLGWRVLNEDFMDFVDRDIFSEIKLRTGWGQVGNARIGAYGFASTVATTQPWAYSHDYVFGDEIAIGAAANSLENRNIKWETVESTNLGVDMEFFNSRVTASVDYFIKETKDMLVRVPLPIYAGYLSSPYSNVGSVENKGVELNFGYQNDARSEFKYSVNFNISSIKNEVLSLGEGQPISGGAFRAFTTTRTEVGHPVGAFYGYVLDGVFQNEEEVAEGNQPNAVPGDFRFKDLDGDGEITAEDRDFIGNPHPDFFYGFNFNAEYKGFDLSLFFQGTQGNDIFNAQKWYTMNPALTTAKSRDILGHWYPGSDINDMYGLNAGSNSDNLRASEFFIEDGSYLRLKNLQLGYTFSSNQQWFSGIRIYFSAQNLLTFTSYSGLDPEIGGGTLSQGLDYGTYPQTRAVSLGINVKL